MYLMMYSKSGSWMQICQDSLYLSSLIIAAVRGCLVNGFGCPVAVTEYVQYSVTVPSCGLHQ